MQESGADREACKLQHVASDAGLWPLQLRLPTHPHLQADGLCSNPATQLTLQAGGKVQLTLQVAVQPLQGAK